MLSGELSNGYLDSLIYSVFEEQEDSFAYPLTSEKEAKDFVLSLHRKGCKYAAIGNEVGSDGVTFEKWRVGAKDSNKTLALKVIERINRPFQDTMASVNDKDGGLLVTQISVGENKIKRPLDTKSFTSKNPSIIGPSLGTDRKNLAATSSSKQAQQQSPPQLMQEVPKMNKNQQLELLLKQKYMFKQSPKQPTSPIKQDSARDQMPYKFTMDSKQPTSAVKQDLARDQIPYKFPSSVTKSQTLTSKQASSTVKQDLSRDQVPYRFPPSVTISPTLNTNLPSSSSVKTSIALATTSNTIYNSKSLITSSLQNPTKPVIPSTNKITTTSYKTETTSNYTASLSASKTVVQTKPSTTKSQPVLQSPTKTKSSTPPTSPTTPTTKKVSSPSTSSSKSPNSPPIKPLSTSTTSTTQTSPKIAATSITLQSPTSTNTTSTAPPPTPNKDEIDVNEADRPPSPIATSAYYQPLTSDFTPEQLNCMINYNSDDDSNSIKNKSSNTSGSLSAKGPGALFLLSDIPAGHMKVSKFTKFRVKLASSRNPINRLKQALNFNPDLRILANIKVDEREVILSKVRSNLTPYAMKNKNDWYWATLNQIFTKIEKALES